MSKKVFISHASADEEIVSKFVDNILCHGCGIKEEDIVYTSRVDSGITNGDDIPAAIKDGIRESVIFFMMVSDNYRNSEVCLNEMGAAWMDDDLIKKIIVLPGVYFNHMGWLMSLKKATSIKDEQGLDAIHDEVCDAMSTRIQTATWNRNRKRFLEEIEGITSSGMDKVSVSLVPVAEEEPMDLLDYQDSFSDHMKRYTAILALFSDATIHYNEEIEKAAARMANLQSNPRALTSNAIRAIMVSIARETDKLSLIYENNTDALREHFEESMASAIELQKSDYYTEEVKDSNRSSVLEMVNTMRTTKNTLNELHKSMDEIPDLDKTFRKSKKRLQAAFKEMVRVVERCIMKGSEFLGV